MNKLTGKQLRQFRKERRITILDLSTLSGISPVGISRFETGKVKPKQETLEVLMDFVEGKL